MDFNAFKNEVDLEVFQLWHTLPVLQSSSPDVDLSGKVNSDGVCGLQGAINHRDISS